MSEGTEKQFLNFFSVNLFAGEDSQKVLEVYLSFLDGIVLHSSPRHSELQLKTGERIVFSVESEDCPVRPGTLTFWTNRDKPISFPPNFRLISSPHHKKYELWEDPFQNWIWVYFLEAK